MSIQKHAPTLNTILMVEEVLKNSDKGNLTLIEIKRLLPKQVNHYTLKTILEYLEQSNKIYVSMKGITWIHNTNEALQKAVKSGMSW